MRPVIRVLVADDSATMRELLTSFLAADARIEVIGCARDGAEVIDLAVRLRPDVITMDIVMPTIDGLSAIAAIMQKSPCRILVVSSVTDAAQVDVAFRAISAGALELIPKPSAAAGHDLGAWARRLADSICLMAEVPVVARHPRAQARSGVSAIGLVASTGGPPALATILRELPATLSARVFVAQHLAPGFAEGLARSLSLVSHMPVRIAEDGEASKVGGVHLAPSGFHLEVGAHGRIQLVAACGELLCPSGDRLLASLAKAYGQSALGVVLTGMGSDGAEGLMTLRRAGGLTMAQDEASSLIYGMPRAAAEAGATSWHVPLGDIAAEIKKLCCK